MHDLIASPFLNGFVLLRPGRLEGIKLPERRFRDLAQARDSGSGIPSWLAEATRTRWAVQLAPRSVGDATLIRDAPAYGHSRASWEINLGCDLDCEHCYLGPKRFAGLDEEGKHRLLLILRDSAVLWLQITGGEALIDPHFASCSQLAHDLGMMIEVLTNGTRLSNSRTLEVLVASRPYRVTVSLYGATAETYDSFTRRRGAFKKVTRGLAAGIEAGLPLQLALIVTAQNAHEHDQMRAAADELGLPYKEYSHMSPTIYGGAESLASQSPAHLKLLQRFAGCNAGHTFLHVDPHGRASICKVGRDEQIDLMTEGVQGLARLGGIADRLMLRTGGCSGCQLSGNCSVCRPLAKRYQEAKAPLNTYCQHGQKGTAT
ncbi:radical SAM protein [Streptomyces kaniharaensis]|uniref:Radical SAM protein n=1 Tax=Streptomyces kaniharaensis TaxID=212423 RepID=A0A6N7KNQ8_9ACTN|nr:radical SAM protein [Streptomyces kaniharaensis]MQS11977.1 radical SAM protein [Streptomyces kaniharaensis]